MGGVIEYVAAFRVLDEHDVRKVVNQREQHIAFFGQCLFGLFTLGDLARDAESADDVPARVSQWQFRGGNPSFRAVGQGRVFLDADQWLARLDDLLLICGRLFGMLGAEEIEVCLPNGLCGIAETESLGLRPAGPRGKVVPSRNVISQCGPTGSPSSTL